MVKTNYYVGRRKIVPGLHKYLIRVLVRDVFEAQFKGERKLREEAQSLALKRVGLGGIKDSTYHTPKPWRYEISFKRKCLWHLLRFLDRFVYGKKNPIYLLPLKTDDYVNGRWVIFHSGVEIKETSRGETTTCSQAYFDPYPGRP